MWREVLRAALLMDAAAAATTDPAKSFDEQLTSERRYLLVEYLLEVSHGWQLDGAVPFLAVRYLDSFTAAMAVPSASLLQLIGICCLRLAMTHVQQQKMKTSEKDKTAGNCAAQESTKTEPNQNTGDTGGNGSSSDQDNRNNDQPLNDSQDNDVNGKGAAASAAAAAASPALRQEVQAQEQKAAAGCGSGCEAAVGAETAAALDVARFVDVCAGAYTADEIERMTALLAAHFGDAPEGQKVAEAAGMTTPEALVRREEERHRRRNVRHAPTARHFLRSLWATATTAMAAAAQDGGVAAAASSEQLAAASRELLVPAALHAPVLQLAGFLLQLSALCPDCSAAPPAHVAAAALSLALEAAGLPPWPQALQRALPLCLLPAPQASAAAIAAAGSGGPKPASADFGSVRRALAAAQRHLAAAGLRSAWLCRMAAEEPAVVTAAADADNTIGGDVAVAAPVGSAAAAAVAEGRTAAQREANGGGEAAIWAVVTAVVRSAGPLPAPLLVIAA